MTNEGEPVEPVNAEPTPTPTAATPPTPPHVPPAPARSDHVMVSRKLLFIGGGALTGLLLFTAGFGVGSWLGGGHEHGHHRGFERNGFGRPGMMRQFQQNGNQPQFRQQLPQGPGGPGGQVPQGPGGPGGQVPQYRRGGQGGQIAPGGPGSQGGQPQPGVPNQPGRQAPQATPTPSATQ